MHHEVTETDTAAAMGSGDVPVLATPRLIAWMEAVTVRAATTFLGRGQTTVGTAIRIEHRRATPVGGSVKINATPPHDVAGSRLTFHVQAVDGSGEVIAAGEIDRAIVDRQHFLASVSDADADHYQRRCGTMELERARSLLDAERARVQQLLAELDTARTDDRVAERDASYPATPLAQQGADDAVAAGLRDRLAALDRALRRVEDGSYGRSIRSGTPIPDERLEADPAAELTVQEAAGDQAADR